MELYQVSDEIRQFLAPVREFCLHNATDEPILIMYSGETRIIPAKDQIAYPHPKFEDVCYSAKDMDGDWIPGTLVLRDMVQMYMNGQEGQVWSAANAIKHALDIDIKSGLASGKYAERGVSLLPPSPSKELVHKLAADGRRRYEAWRIKTAKEVAEAYEGRIAALKAAGHNPIPLGPDYDRARAIIDASRDVEKARYTPVPFTPQPVEDEPVDEDDLARVFAAKLSKMVGPTVNKAALVEQVINDPETMKLLKAKYKVRKLRESKLVPQP